MALVFSDLHATLPRLPLVLEVLRRVHAEAVRRGCAVFFAGDFFDKTYCACLQGYTSRLSL